VRYPHFRDEAPRIFVAGSLTQLYDLKDAIETLVEPVSSYRCDIPTQLLVRYFAQLAYEALSPARERYSIGMLPIPIQQTVRGYTREGRMLAAASITPQGDLIRLFFGERDAAISDYF
jgi:hypothetical protein